MKAIERTLDSSSYGVGGTLWRSDGGYIVIYTLPHTKISLPKKFLYGISSPVTQDRCDVVPLCAPVKIYTPPMKLLATPLGVPLSPIHTAPS